MSAAYAVTSALNNPDLSIKWPNDIMLYGRKLGGILTESRSDSNESKIVLGIGLNISDDGSISEFTYSSISEISEIDIHELDRILNTSISSLFEIRKGLPPPDLNFAMERVVELIQKFGIPILDDKVYPNFSISKQGELILGEKTINDLDSIEWSQFSNNASKGS